MMTNKKSIVVGMGIGGLYRDVLTKLGFRVITVDMDPNKRADYTSVDDALKDHPFFDTANICTPNFTHEELARKLAPYASIVFVEKPGVRSASDWYKLCKDFPLTRFMMVKNNQWRNERQTFYEAAHNSRTININWINNNRIPNPGSWFTNKELAFGGVSRDLMPHLLSYITYFFNSSELKATGGVSLGRYTLEDINSTDYGVVNKNGVYDVDDFCKLCYTGPHDVEINLVASWKSDSKDELYISFGMENSAVRYDLGLCPENAYQKMIASAFDNIDDRFFWHRQLEQDIWIHEQIENL